MNSTRPIAKPISVRCSALLCVSLALWTAGCGSDTPGAVVKAGDATIVASGGELAQIVDAQLPKLESLYLECHKNPELSLQEVQTAKRLATPLRELGYDVTENVGGHGIVAVMKNGPGKTLLIRTDLDALPVREQTGASYASQVKATDASGREVSVMHACGHDIHIASMLGTAIAMRELKSRWHGTLILIGQPAEEIVAGARAMLKDRLFDRFGRPDWCLAMHVDSELAVGSIGWVSGYAMANVDSVNIVVRGVGGHGAHPERTKDPVVLASQIVLALQTIASRENTPTDPIVITVGTIHGGAKRNIIPDEVKLELTVRTYKEEVRKRTLESIRRIAKGTAIAAGIPATLEPQVTVTDESSPALYNTPALVDRTTNVLRAVLGQDNVIAREPAMVAEDFGIFGNSAEPKIPSFMFRLGSIPKARIDQSRQPGATPLPALHSPFYLPDSKPTIRTGVIAMTSAAVDLLGK